MADPRKQNAKKPVPQMLGSGLAAKAGMKLGQRGRQIDAAVDAATRQTTDRTNGRK